MCEKELIVLALNFDLSKLLGQSSLLSAIGDLVQTRQLQVWAKSAKVSQNSPSASLTKIRQLLSKLVKREFD
jgi:hypothetical protein